jgi:hypothetical protein
MLGTCLLPVPRLGALAKTPEDNEGLAKVSVDNTR